jgi:hypothetical protein
VAYGARLESVLGESPRGFESPILREKLACTTCTVTKHQDALTRFDGLRQGGQLCDR